MSSSQIEEIYYFKNPSAKTIARLQTVAGTRQEDGFRTEDSRETLMHIIGAMTDSIEKFQPRLATENGKPVMSRIAKIISNDCIVGLGHSNIRQILSEAHKDFIATNKNKQ